MTKRPPSNQLPPLPWPPPHSLQVKSYCEMESHEEKLHKMIIASKIKDTEDIMKRKALEIDKHKVRGG